MYTVLDTVLYLFHYILNLCYSLTWAVCICLLNTNNKNE